MVSLMNHEKYKVQNVCADEQMNSNFFYLRLTHAFHLLRLLIHSFFLLDDKIGEAAFL